MLRRRTGGAGRGARNGGGREDYSGGDLSLARDLSNSNGWNDCRQGRRNTSNNDSRLTGLLLREGDGNHHRADDGEQETHGEGLHCVKYGLKVENKLREDGMRLVEGGTGSHRFVGNTTN
jgi:hypothetical protein